MGLRQEFSQTLQDAGFCQKSLVALMAEIDEEKRSIKSMLSQLSSEPDEHHAKGRERQTKIRRMKDKISFLTEEREAVRTKLGQIKMDKKALNRHAHTKCVDFAHAFMAAAERVLSEEAFTEIELRASEILQTE